MDEIRGWRGICQNKGKFVPFEDGFEYAAAEVGILAFDNNAPGADDFKEALIEWFYSGNWIEVTDDGRD